jgi:hypothetical protein
MQRHANLAEVFGGRRGKGLATALRADDRPRASSDRYVVVMPAKEQRLEQDRGNADQRDPAVDRMTRG